MAVSVLSYEYLYPASRDRRQIEGEAGTHRYAETSAQLLSGNGGHGQITVRRLH